MEKINLPIQKLLVFGGSYSNLQALEALKNWATLNNFSSHEIICTGDIVGYCAQPLESINLVKEWGIHCIAGNVEIQLAEELDDCGCNFNESSSCDLYSKQWYPFAQSQLTIDAIRWLKNLPNHLRFEFGHETWGIVHGSFSETAQFIFKSSSWKEKQKQIKAMGVNHIISGHSGIPFLHHQNGKSWSNSGALGMPANDGSPNTWFMTIESKNNAFIFEFKELYYDHLIAKEEMEKAKLPVGYSDCLETGFWPSTDILRDEEVAETGIKLSFLPTIIDGIGTK